MDKTQKEVKNKKVYWCQCIMEGQKFAKKIKKGSVPKDTGNICDECGGIIFEEDAK